MNGHNDNAKPGTRAIRPVLVIALGLNAAMFAIEMAASLGADSVALQADALDFFGDTVTYALSLAVLGMSLARRNAAALFKGVSMALMGLWVLGATAHAAWVQPLPSVEVMGAVGVAVQSQRRHRQSRRTRSCRWGVRHRHGVAGPRRRRAPWRADRRRVVPLKLRRPESSG